MACPSFLTLEDGMDSLSQNFGMNYHSLLCKVPKYWRFRLHGGGSLKSCMHLHYMIASIQSTLVFHFIGSSLVPVNVCTNCYF